MATFKKYRNKNNETLYSFKVYLGTDPVSGKRIETTRRGFKTKREANNVLNILRSEYNSGNFGSNNSIITNFDELYNLWFESYQTTVKQSTATDCWWLYKRYIKPKFGKLKIEKINVSFCQKSVNYWHKYYREYRHIKNLVAQILNYAINLEIIDSNPMKKVVVPRPLPKDEKKENFYTRDELTYFFECLDSIGDKRYIAFFRLLAFTGLRKSEALSLQWKDINYKNGTVKIYKTLYLDARTHKVIIQTPKTSSSEREIELDNKTVSLLKSWRIDQQERLLKNGINSMTSNQFLFTQMKTNKLLIPNRANDWLKWIYKKYPQKKITVHGFRHTHASLLFEAGASIKEVQDRLGHSNSKTTLDIYTHVTQKAKRDTAEKFARYIDF